MKKTKNIEMKIYELLGVKVFRKIAFAIRDTLVFPLTIIMFKENRKYFLYSTPSNYNLGKVKSLEDVKKFKKKLYINAGIHIYGLLLCLFHLLIIFGGTVSLSETIICLTSMGINLYCIMLQRYNCIRINKFIKKMTPRYEKQKDAIKEELRKNDSLLLEHTYKIVDKKEKEISITLEDLIAKANIEQLKQYRNYLLSVSQIIQENKMYFANQQVDISMPIEKHRKLKLELKDNRQYNCANN